MQDKEGWDNEARATSHSRDDATWDDSSGSATWLCKVCKPHSVLKWQGSCGQRGCQAEAKTSS